MYKRNSQGWRKHLDFILVDEVVLFLCLTLALFIRTRAFPYRIQIYRVLCIVYLLINLMVAIVFNTMHNVVKRGLFNEFVHTLTHCFLGFAFAALFLFATQMGIAYSRIALFLIFIFHVLFGFVIRITWKAFIKKRGLSKSAMAAMVLAVQQARLYIAGSSLPEICRSLEKDRIPSMSGKTKWYPICVSEMLHNERYIGDLRMQKSYISDPIQHTQV